MGLLARPATPGSTASSHKSASAVILDGTIISLSLLEKMVDGVQIPFLKGSVGAALEMIKIAKAVHMNKLDCEDLILRTTSLLVVILGSLNGKEEKDIPEGLRRNIERLSGSFHQVLGELRTIERRAQKSITGFVYYLDNAEKLKSCVMKLDWAMQEFQVTSKVDTCLSELQRYEQLQKGQTEILEAVGKSQAEILEAVGKTQKELSIISISLSSSVMPEDPIIFGREAYVERAVILILSNDQVRLAILGPGGMGKTSVALKIVHDARVVARFGRRCYWVPCEQATSLNMFIELIAKSLDLPATTSNDRFKDIIASLESTIVLRFFLLDNFETTWDIEGQQSEIAQHLSRLASVPGVSFIVTMRGTHYPTLNSTQWTQPRLPALEPLALDPARQAFLRIAPSATEDSELDSLIKEVDRMPLAITLMAKLADAGESPTDLLEQWKIELTGLLDQAGGDRSNSIEVSIRLSLQGNSVKHCPEATDFLRILARLPAGMPLDKISHFCPSITNWRKAIRILRGASLIYDSADKLSVQLLSPIRSFILLHYPIADGPLQDLRSSFYKLGLKGISFPGDQDFLLNKEMLEQVEINLEAILLDALQSETADKEVAIQASANYAQFLYWTQCRTEVIAKAVEVAAGCNSRLYGECQYRFGEILRTRAEYPEAESAYKEAKAHFEEHGDTRWVAQCLRALGVMYRRRQRYSEAESLLSEAQSAYADIGSQAGMTQCLKDLGNIYLERLELERAESVLMEAKSEFIRTGSRMDIADCLSSISEMYRFQGRWEEAESMVKEAQSMYTLIGNHEGAAKCKMSLGDMLRMTDRLDEAEAILQESRSQFIHFGCALEAALCLAEIGSISRLQGKTAKALEELNEAKTLLSTYGHNWVDFCQQELDEITQLDVPNVT